MARPNRTVYNFRHKTFFQQVAFFPHDRQHPMAARARAEQFADAFKHFGIVTRVTTRRGTGDTQMIKAGQRFYHAKWLDPTTMGANPQPALMQVTRVTKDSIYYGWVHNYGDREELGKSREWATPERFMNHCLLRLA